MKNCTSCYHSEMDEEAGEFGRIYTCNFDGEKPTTVNIETDIYAFPCDDWERDD